MSEHWRTIQRVRIGQSSKIKGLDRTEQAGLIAKLAKKQPRLAAVLAGLDWSGLSFSAARAALEQMARAENLIFGQAFKEPLRGAAKGGKIVGVVSLGEIEFGLVQSPDGGILSVERGACNEGAELADNQARLKSWRQDFEDAYRKQAMTVVFGLLGCQVKQTADAQGHQVIVGIKA